MKTLDDIFARTREEGECRIWTGLVSTDGAPVAYSKRQKKHVRRAVYELAYNIELRRGVRVRHWCENNLCLAPKHLYSTAWDGVEPPPNVTKQIPETGCLLWLGPTDVDGYGLAVHQGRQAKAHRRAWETANGPIPEGLQVNHLCNNPPCVNVAHLVLGTCAENLAYRNACGRQARGEKQGSAKLTGRQVEGIRNLAAVVPVEEIALWHGIDRATVYRIVNGEMWRHTLPPDELARLDAMDRKYVGERHHEAKLTEDDVREIRRRAGTASQAQLGREFGVFQQTICRVISREAWTHVRDVEEVDS